MENFISLMKASQRICLFSPVSALIVHGKVVVGLLYLPRMKKASGYAGGKLSMAPPVYRLFTSMCIPGARRCELPLLQSR